MFTFFGLLGCSHKRTTFPITPRRPAAVKSDETPRGPYVTCLDCGTEFDYSWKDMKIGARKEAQAA